MNRPQEQITEKAFYDNPEHWDSYARRIGGIEVCDDETGEPIFVIGQL